MLARKHRLNISKFKKSEATKIDDENFRILYFKEDANQKWAIVISKKVAKLAVDRNRVRRIVSEALKNIKPEGVYLVYVKRNMKNLKEIEARKSLMSLIKKIK